MLGKLKAAAGLPVRDILSKVSKRERLMLPDAESIRVILDNMVATGRAAVEGNNYRTAAIMSVASGLLGFKAAPADHLT